MVGVRGRVHGHPSTTVGQGPCVDGSGLSRDFRRCRRWSVQPWVRSFGAAHMTTGHRGCVKLGASSPPRPPASPLTSPEAPTASPSAAITRCRLRHLQASRTLWIFTVVFSADKGRSICLAGAAMFMSSVPEPVVRLEPRRQTARADRASQQKPNRLTPAFRRRFPILRPKCLPIDAALPAGRMRTVTTNRH